MALTSQGQTHPNHITGDLAPQRRPSLARRLERPLRVIEEALSDGPEVGGLLLAEALRKVETKVADEAA